LPPAAGDERSPENGQKWALALRQLTEALDLLDQSNAPPEIGARLTEAIDLLREALNR
jgi:hypothetical protein